MNKSQTTVNRQLFTKLVEERGGTLQFLSQMGMSESRLRHLLENAAEASQSEMLRAASVLKLSELEFMRCFFSQ